MTDEMTKAVEEVRRAAFGKWWDSLPWVMCEKCSGDKEIAWRGFNAGLDAVEIELPHEVSHVTCKPFEEGRDAVLVAIEQNGLGLKVKS